jgi:hypothetical protein
MQKLSFPEAARQSTSRAEAWFVLRTSSISQERIPMEEMLMWIRDANMMWP